MKISDEQCPECKEWVESLSDKNLMHNWQVLAREMFRRFPALAAVSNALEAQINSGSALETEVATVEAELQRKANPKSSH